MNNVPVDMLINHGYKDIIVIRIFGIGREKRVKIPPSGEKFFQPESAEKVLVPSPLYDTPLVPCPGLKASELPEGTLKDYLLASAYFPAFRIEKILGKIPGFFPAAIYIIILSCQPAKKPKSVIIPCFYIFTAFLSIEPH